MARKGARGDSKHKGNHLADMSVDPAKRRRRKSTRTSRKPVPAQERHALTPRGRRRRREGERAMERERDSGWG